MGNEKYKIKRIITISTIVVVILLVIIIAFALIAPDITTEFYVLPTYLTQPIATFTP
jgi:predicted PurR-regulated permease PerM